MNSNFALDLQSLWHEKNTWMKHRADEGKANTPIFASMIAFYVLLETLTVLPYTNLIRRARKRWGSSLVSLESWFVLSKMLHISENYTSGDIWKT